jgi:hypothetical protein
MNLDPWDTFQTEDPELTGNPGIGPGCGIIAFIIFCVVLFLCIC